MSSCCETIARCSPSVVLTKQANGNRIIYLQKYAFHCSTVFVLTALSSWVGGHGPGLICNRLADVNYVYDLFNPFSLPVETDFIHSVSIHWLRVG